MKKFQSINEWEQEKTPEPEYGCVMMDAKILDWEENHIEGIDPNDVYIKPLDDSYGLEDNPHVTIIYGIHEDEIDPEVIMDVIQNEMERCTVEINNISIFENEEYDVVKYDVPVTEELQKYRDRFENSFANTQSFPDYHPHITLAYVKPGEGKKYVKELDEPFEVSFEKGVYSFHDEDGELKRKEHVWPDPEEEQIDLTQ